MESNNRIGFAESLCVLLIVIISHLILTLPKIILQSQGSSSIINVIYITFIALFIIFILNLLYKNFKGMDILDVSNYIFGKKFKFIVGIAYIGYLIFVCSLLLRTTSENLKTLYFQSTHIPYILFFILFAVGFINRYSLKVVVKCNMIVVPLIIFALSILFILSSKEFTFERIFPILGYGTKNTFVYGITNILGFGNIVFLFFIMPLLKDYNQFKKLSYTSVLISGIFILLTITALLLIFPIDISAGPNSPIYLQTRIINFGKFIERIDSFFVLVWIIGILSYISIIISFILSIFKKITNIQDHSVISRIFLSILFGVSILYKNVIQIRAINLELFKYLAFIFVFGFSFFIFTLANIKNKFRKNNLKGDNQIE